VDRPGLKLFASATVQVPREVLEEGDVPAPLPEKQRLLYSGRFCRKYSYRPVADLPAVAVRAVQHVAAPPLPDTGHLRQLILKAGRDEQSPRTEILPVLQLSGEDTPFVPSGDCSAVQDLATVHPHFRTAGGK
jgi:hypothetical protein